MLTVADDNSRVIISRIQNRSGLKQDLPQPLRPGELGFAVDSRQLYIGGDADHPNAVQYNNLSYFENTVNARDHGISIANNNIIAFTVPYIKYTKGEFNGVGKSKQWFPTDARSIIDSVDKPECAHMDYTKPVFSAVITDDVSSTISTGTSGSTAIFVTVTGGTDTTGNIRSGDTVIIDGVTEENLLVDNVYLNGSEYQVFLNKAVNTTTGSNITFSANNIKNFTTGATFKSGEVLVYKNGLKLQGDPDNASLTIPAAAYDYVLNAANSDVSSAHTLNLRTRPSASDDVSICYYGSDAVIQALEGMPQTGKISPYANINSFYTEYNIPEYRQIDRENVTLSETSGLGFIGLEHKHIVSAADGTANVATPSSVTLGNLLVARNDIVWTSNTTIKNSVNPEDQWDLVLEPEQSLILSPVGDGGTYRYNRLLLKSTSDQTLYFHNRIFDVASASSNGNVTINVPLREFALYRSGDAYLSTTYSVTNGYRVNITGITQASPAVVTTDRPHTYSNGDKITITDVSGMVELNNTTFYVGDVTSDTFGLYTGPALSVSDEEDSTGYTAYTTGGVSRKEGIQNTYVTVQGDTEGVSVNDWVRIFDEAGNVDYNPLHDSIFKVRAVRDSEGEFDVLLDNTFMIGDVPSFTENVANVLYINHGNDSNETSNVFQVYSVDHGLSSGVDTITVETGDGTMFVDGNLYSISNLPQDITENTFFIEDFTGTLPPSTANWDIAGVEFKPTLDMSYTDITATPILSIDLRNANTLADVLATVNKSLVSTKAGSEPEEIFPTMDYLPQTDGSLNRVFLSQDPAYSSVGVGGLEFSLFEDYTNNTLSVLKLESGIYDREVNTVRAKLETWINGLVASRDLNLFTSALLLGSPYSSNTGNMGTYRLQIDDTYDDIIFCTRDEARNFNAVVNKAYSQSPFDRAEDDRNGTRGIVNLKNNLEITTLEQAGLGAKITTYPTMEAGFILRGALPLTEVFRISLSVYDSFILEYSISETGGTAIDKYSRVGTMHIVARSDFADPNNAVSIIDNFSSSYERNSVSSDPVVEPRFDGKIENDYIVVYLVEQFRDPLNPVGGDEVGHTLDCDLKLRFIERRWTSTD